MPTDAELLHRYVKLHDESAFTELVERHVGIVYAAALRRTGGRAHLVEDVAQKVFSDLARKAAMLVKHPALTGWLYQSTRYAVTDAMRAEHRKQKLAMALASDASVSEENTGDSIDWEKVQPVLDQAMDQLKGEDREIMLLRYFRGLPFAEIGVQLELNENTARMRSERALKKLRSYLGRRGVTSTTAAITLFLTSQSLNAAPAGAAAKISSSALAAASATPAAGVASFLIMNKITLAVLSAGFASGLGFMVWNSTTLNVSATELAALRAENTRLSAAIMPGASTPSLEAAATEGSLQMLGIAKVVAKQHLTHLKMAEDSNPLNRHRNRGQATPLDVELSTAWASDTADVAALAKLIYFEPTVRTQALAVLATMPDALRSEYPTPEEFYAFLFVADALVAPPPGPDILEKNKTLEISPGRAAVLKPGAPLRSNSRQYQRTDSGWKWIVPLGAVENAPQILTNASLAKLETP